MEKRIGVVSILVDDRKFVKDLNSILSSYSEIIIGRMGLPVRDRGIHVISLIVEGTTDEIGAMAGRAGRLSGIQVKSILTRFREDNNENTPQNTSGP